MSITGLGSGMSASYSNIVKEGKGKGQLGEADFMMLLTEQIKNQDPLNPMENTEFIAQMAQFNSLDQMSKMNVTLNNIMMGQASQNNAAAVSLIGKVIELPGDTVDLTASGTDLAYRLPQNAVSVSVNIFDSGRKEVATLNGLPTDKGSQSVHWDGMNSEGVQLPDGSYSFSVIAKDADGEPIPVTELMVGKATDLIFENNGTYLYVNGKKVSLGQVSRISQE